MLVNVLLFASYADVLGSSQLSIELPEGANVATLRDHLQRLTAGRSLPPARVAINQSMAGDADLLSPSDEVAIIPPVAGG